MAAGVDLGKEGVLVEVVDLVRAEDLAVEALEAEVEVEVEVEGVAESDITKLKPMTLH